MKKIVASVGLAALGASSLQAATLPAIVAEEGKPWTISATLRGFYDDNFNAAPDAADLGDYERHSLGFEVNPAITLAFPLGQTAIGLGYSYSYKNYENRPVGSDSHDDSSHTFNVSLDHAFNPRFGLAVRDSFVIGQEPDLLRTGNAMTTFQRVPGDNMRNFGSIDFRGMLTEVIGFEVGYANSYFNYDDDDPIDDGFGSVAYPSLSGLLDRLEHAVHLDGRFQVQPQTAAILGYQYRDIDYTGDEVIAGALPADPDFSIFSEDRNSRSHYGYAGLEHSFDSNLTAALRAGAHYTDYYNDDTQEGNWSPYALASVRYTYRPDSFVEVGVTHDMNATDIIGADTTGDDGFTVDQESTVVYLSLNHRFSPRLLGTVLGQFQNSTFNGGMYDGESEQYYMAGVNLEYQFNRYFSAHAGYNYDMLDSELGDIRDLHRNRVYIGVTARY